MSQQCEELHPKRARRHCSLPVSLLKKVPDALQHARATGEKLARGDPRLDVHLSRHKPKSKQRIERIAKAIAAAMRSVPTHGIKNDLATSLECWTFSQEGELRWKSELAHANGRTRTKKGQGRAC